MNQPPHSPSRTPDPGVGAASGADNPAARQHTGHSEEHYRWLTEAAPLLLWSTWPDGRADFLNDRWCEYTGQTHAEAEGYGWLDVLHPDDRGRTSEEWKRCVATGDPYEVHYRLRSAAGEYRWFMVRGIPFKDTHGVTVKWYGSSTDIHRQIVTAEALREESLITQKMYEVSCALSTEQDLSKVVQLITDVGTRITRAQFGAFFYNVLTEDGGSYMLYTLSGVPREAFANFPMPRATALFGPTFRGEGVIRAEDIRQDPRFGLNAPHHGMPRGHLPVVSYLAVPVISRNGEVLGGLFFGHAQPGVFTVRDEQAITGLAAQAAAATDSARLLSAAQQSRAAAEEANQAKDRFLATLSHELRTPLTPVLAIVSSLREDPSLRPDIAEQLEVVQRNAELEARLIDDLLDLTRVTTGKLELRTENMTADALIADAIRACRNEALAAGLNIICEPPAFEVTLSADRARLTQVLSNLLRNAIKFTAAGGLIKVRWHVCGDEGAPRLVVEVEDTGIGISADMLPRIFDAFEQGGRITTQRFGGLGLGLAISKSITEAHGGCLEATSGGHDCGSTFRLTLPLPLAEAGETKPAAQAPSQAGVSAAPNVPVRILLAEDHADTAAALTSLLSRAGYQIYHADSIAAATATAEKMMRDGGLDLVVSDLGLLDGTGHELLRKLNACFGPLRAIALSGYGMESDLAQSAAAGFTRHLIKPVRISDLRAAIAAVLGG